MRYNKTDRETVVIGHYWKLFPVSLGNITLRLQRRAIFPKHRGNNFQ